METTLGKAPAIYNGHQPPRAVYPYMGLMETSLFGTKPSMNGLKTTRHWNPSKQLYVVTGMKDLLQVQILPFGSY